VRRRPMPHETLRCRSRPLNRLLRMVRASLLSSLGGAALLRVVTSCAEGDPIAPHVAEAGPEPAPEAAVLPEQPDAAPPSHCEPGQWCVVTLPVTTQVSINGVWGSGPNDVWIVGSPDLILHWEGTHLTRSTAHRADVPLATKQTLFGVWGSGANDVWTFNAGDSLWHTGGADLWSASRTDAPPPKPSLITAMWGRSANDIWAVGPLSYTTLAPTVWHCDGWHEGVVKWVPSRSDVNNNPDFFGFSFSFNAIWGNSSDVWIVGQNGKTRRTDGWNGESTTTWTPIESATSLDLNTVWGSSNGEVWAAGAGGVVRRFSPQTDGTYRVSSLDLPRRVTIFALTGFGPNDVWAAGADGTLAHWDGQTWSFVEMPVVENAPHDLLAIWGASADDIWVTGQNLLLHKGSAVLPGTTVRKP
jgi:hypothetical protein